MEKIDKDLIVFESNNTDNHQGTRSGPSPDVFHTENKSNFDYNFKQKKSDGDQARVSRTPIKMRRNKFLEKPPNAKHLMKMVPSEEILIPSNSSMEISEPVPPRPTKFLDKEDSLLDLSLIEIPKSPPTQSPQWVLNILSRISNLLSNQASITIHRSKLFSLFDDFRSLSRNFFPNTLLDSSILGPACHLFVETLEKARQLVYNCSASHWSQSAIMWHTNYACTSIRRIREDTNECLISLQCQNAPNFIKSDEELKAQNNVDLLRLKGTLMNYLTRVDEQENKTPKMEQIEQLIKERIRSIGPIEGLYDGPAVVSIPPFLPSKLNLVLKHEDFELGKIIGSGTFGCVYRGILKSTNQKVAIKVLNTNSLGGRQLETFKREVWTMANLNHPSILRLLGVTLTAPFCIVTELLKCSLFDKMKYLSATKKSIIACKVSQAMEQLHSARIIHRDLKSANILLDDDDLPRVCDFGLVGFKTGGTKTGFIGTAQWMAPEILRSSPFYDEKVDVYSFGILLWELLTLSVPYNGMTQDQMVMSIIEHGARPEIPLNAGPPKLINLMKRCWSEDPIERPSFQQISIILYSPDVHFIGTNEIEFSEKTPHESLSSSIISAFDTCNWKLLDELILEITPEKFDEDNELIDTIVSLFPNFDSERQANIILHLPQMVDLQSFLCLKGYQFIVSLFSYTSIVIEAIVNTLKTLDLSSKGFRQVKLLNTIAHSKNEAALELCIDLCQFFDIAKYITENDLPIPYEGLLTLLLYKQLLSFQELRSKISHFNQPLFLARLYILQNPILVCECLMNYTFLMEQSNIIVKLNLIPLFIETSKITDQALHILAKMFVVCTIDQLSNYRQMIAEMVRKHKNFFDQENILLKLLSLEKINVSK